MIQALVSDWRRILIWSFIWYALISGSLFIGFMSADSPFAPAYLPYAAAAALLGAGGILAFVARFRHRRGVQAKLFRDGSEFVSFIAPFCIGVIISCLYFYSQGLRF